MSCPYKATSSHRNLPPESGSEWFRRSADYLPHQPDHQTHQQHESNRYASEQQPAFAGCRGVFERLPLCRAHRRRAERDGGTAFLFDLIEIGTELRSIGIAVVGMFREAFQHDALEA